MCRKTRIIFIGDNFHVPQYWYGIYEFLLKNETHFFKKNFFLIRLYIKSGSLHEFLLRIIFGLIINIGGFILVGHTKEIREECLSMIQINAWIY